MKINELVEKKQLIRQKISVQQVQGSLQLAERFLERAKGNLKIDFWDVAFLMAYQSMFHSARALLFKNNLKERSHAAMISALKELYSKNAELMEFLNFLSSCRMSRHAIQYDGSLCSKTDAFEIVKDAEKFLAKLDEILNRLSH